MHAECTVKSRNLWTQVQGEKSCTFFSIGLWRFNAWHWNTGAKTACTQWSACWTKVPLFSKHPAQQNWCFDYENNDKLHRMTTQNVRKKIPHAVHLKLTILIKYITSYIKKCETGTYFFWLSVCQYVGGRRPPVGFKTNRIIMNLYLKFH